MTKGRKKWPRSFDLLKAEDPGGAVRIVVHGTERSGVTRSRSWAPELAAPRLRPAVFSPHVLGSAASRTWQLSERILAQDLGAWPKFSASFSFLWIWLRITVSGSDKSLQGPLWAVVCKQTLTDTNSGAMFDPDFKRIGGDGGNEVTLPQHVSTDSSCSSKALCPLGESGACQRDDYIKKKLQKRKQKGWFKRWPLKASKETKGASLQQAAKGTALCREWLHLARAAGGGRRTAALWPRVGRGTPPLRPPRLANRQGGRGQEWRGGGRHGMWVRTPGSQCILEELVPLDGSMWSPAPKERKRAFLSLPFPLRPT